ncbi:MAG TPA: ATP-dependent DNA helicase, partial [Thermoanaerobaculia bacterium]
SDELSRSVSDFRKDVVDGLQPTDIEGITEPAAQEITTYLTAARAALGAIPTQDTIIVERFFDESGGMQLVLHAPFGSRINRAWGLALRKRFCRQFNFELQAAATEDAVLLSLGPQHSFPLADVFRYLHPATARDVLVQAFLDAPVFQTRWRWNSTISLAIPRNRGGKKVPAPLQRAMADDLMAAVFPDAAACAENIQGDRQLPDHPLINQTVRDCLEEAMDFEGLARVLGRIHRGEIECIARDTVEPSPLSHDIINSAPFSFLDDAPLEERRTHMVSTGRSGILDESAIERVRDEERPDPRDADELHDAMLTAGYLHDDEISREMMDTLVAARRAGCLNGVWVTAERLPEFLAVHRQTVNFSAPPSRVRTWTREDAIVELLRGRLSLVGPTTAQALSESLRITESEANTALLTLESEGAILRGTFEGPNEWCDRRLLARIHRYTLNRLRAEIEPVNVADLTRFLFSWQHVTLKLSGVDGLRKILHQLEGFEVSVTAWEKSILPARMDRYDSSFLDTLSLGGEIGWAKLTSGVALFPRDHMDAWLPTDLPQTLLSVAAQNILDTLRSRGASFLKRDEALEELIEAGLVTSDGFAGRHGRWSLLSQARDGSFAGAQDKWTEIQAWALLRRYGVVFRRMLTREPAAAPWRDLARVYRRLEARGEIRGGRFVNGMSGEQFALPEAVERLREVRREGPDGRVIAISACDPLNLAGILDSGERIRAVATNRIAYRDGVPMSVMEGDYLRPLAEIDSTIAMEVASALAGRRVPVASGFVGR